ncbi:MAG: histidine kinase [Williamsia sp.]|nr:histidine kinase [Williamsia sp.]
MFSVFSLRAQVDSIPVFKQVILPGSPSITSEYFFFSEDGLMWFSTAQGLNSFDGSDLVCHSSLQQANLFSLNYINAMVEDDRHNFYIGTPAGLYYYNRSAGSYTDIAISPRKGGPLFHPGIAALHLDHKGVLFAGSANSGLLVYDPAATRLAHYNLDNSTRIDWQDRSLNTVVSFAPHATDESKLWIGSFHGIYLFDKVKKTFLQNFRIVTDVYHQYAPFSTGHVSVDVQRMDVVNDSIIWFNSWAGGFACYNTRTGEVTIPFGRSGLFHAKHVYYGYIIPEFVKWSPGKYLLGVYNGQTAIYDTRSGNARYFKVADNKYTEEQTKFVTQDRRGNTWLLQRGRLYVSLPPGLRLRTVEVPNQTAVSFSRPDMRGIWFDTATGFFYGAFMSSTGVHVFDTSFRLQTIIPTPLINSFFSYASSLDKEIIKDGSGRFWTTGWKTHVLLPGKKRFEPVEKVFPSLSRMGTENLFDGLLVSRKGDILIRRTDGLLYQINHHSLKVDSLYCKPLSNSGAEIRMTKNWYDGDRNMVYLTAKNCLEQVSLDDGKHRRVPNLSLLGNSPLPHYGACLCTLDAAGRIWCMVRESGVRIIDPHSLRCIDSIEFGSRGLIRGGYTAIVGGLRNYMLFRAQNGVVVYDTRKQQSFFFDHSNGLASPDLKSLLYSHGYMLVGENSSFEYFNLTDLDNYSTEIIPYVNTIMADTLPVFVRADLRQHAPLRLPHDQNTLMISFSATEFFFPERLEYAYRLKGIDNKWHCVNSSNRKISYSQLKPGTYVFCLMAQREGGNWQGKAVEYTISIVPAFWQTLLFKLLVGLAVATGAYLLYRRRITFIRQQHVRQAAQEKALLELEARALRSQMNPHFIFNSLNSIKSLINKNQNEPAAVYLTTFSKLIRTLFQHSDKREISLYEELETCRLYTQLEKMRFGEKVDFVFDIEEGIDLKDIKVPALVLQPFIENAIWHGLIPREEGGKLAVTVSQHDGTVECTIDDNGVGRDVSAKYKTGLAVYESKGISLTQSRLRLDKLMNNREDTLLIIDKKDEKDCAAGTTVIIRFTQHNS